MNATSPMTVLITRPQDASPDMQALLQAQGHTVLCAPMTDYIARSADMSGLEKAKAILATSRMGITRFAQESARRDLPVLAVGDTTAAAARALGFNTVMSARGDTAALAALLSEAKRDLSIRHIFHPRGQEIASDYKSLCEGQGITLRDAVLYEAAPVPALPPDIAEALKAGHIHAVMFLSTSAVQNFIRLAKAQDLSEKCADMMAVCISARVAKAAPADFFGRISISEQPTVRSMCAALGKSSQTVQGWGQGSTKMTTADKKNEDEKPQTPSTNQTANHDAWKERRHGDDRRRRHATPDRRGNIKADSYEGPDRRAGIDRRAFIERQQHRIRAEKQKFVSRTMLTMAFLFVPVTLAGVFVMAPEYLELKEKSAQMGTYEAQMQQMNARLDAIAQHQEKQTSISATINRQIAKIESAASTVKETAGGVADTALSVAGAAALQNENTRQFLALLSGLGVLNKTPEGRTAVVAGTDRLKTVLAGWNGDKSTLNDAVEVARTQDPTLGALLSGIDKKDLGAAAMILAMNEFRGNVGAQRPFESDLVLLEKFAKDDPKMQASLKKLAPYGKSGVLDRQALSGEFKGLAMDIVMAKLQGEDLTVQEQALKRMQNFVKMRKISDVQGESVDAVVARAQLMLDQGDVQGATAELQKLDGAPAQVAQPFIEQAQGQAVASEMSGLIVNTMVSQLANPSGFTVDGFTNALRDAAQTGLSATGLEDIIPVPDAPSAGPAYPYSTK